MAFSVAKSATWCKSLEVARVANVFIMNKMICEVLASYANFKGNLHDDTLLEKFENFVQTHLLVSRDEIRAETGSQLKDAVQDFLTAVTAIDEVQPEKLVLTLKLGAGLLLYLKTLHTHKDTNDVMDKLSNTFFILMNKCLKAEHWSEPSVRNAWLHALVSLVTLEQFLIKVVTSARLLETIVLATDDSSLFVAKMARTALGKVLFQCLVNGYNAETSGVKPPVTSHEECKLILEDLHTAIKQGSTHKSAARATVSIGAAITVLSLLFDETLLLKSEGFVKIKLEQLQFDRIVHDLAKQLLTGAVQYYDDILRIISECQHCGLASESDLCYVTDSPEHLMKEKHIKASMLLAFSLLKVNIFKGSDNEDKLMNIIQCPLTVYTGSGQDIPSTKALQQDLKKSSHLILSINLLMKLPSSLRKPSHELKAVELLLERLSNVTPVCAVHCQLNTSALSWFADLLDACLSNGSTDIPYSTFFKLCSCFTKGSSTVVDAAYKCMTVILKHHPDTKLQEMQQCLERNLSDMQWEVRDSGLLTISNLALVGKDSPVISKWLEQSPLLHLTMQCTSDGEAYVRASAIAALEKIVLSATQAKLADEVFESAHHLVSHDTEAIVRRAAIATMCKIVGSFYQDNTERNCQISDRIKDLDWQVKLHIINHCKALVDRMKNTDLPAYAAGIVTADEHAKHDKLLFEKLCHYKYISALIMGLQDCDLIVQYQSCEVLYVLKDICQQISFSENSHVVTNTCQNISDCIKSPKELEIYNEDPAKMHNMLLNCTLPDRQALSDASIDTYVNPMSMLQDLLTAMKPQEENQIIDCY